MADKEVTLIKVNANENNNKFYRVTLDGQTVTKTWGRVGTYGQSMTEDTGEVGFQRAIRSKKKGGYKEVDVTRTATKETGSKTILRKVAAEKLAGGADGPVADAVSYLADQNRHEIVKTSGGLLNVDQSGMVTTPLGVISRNSISEASKILTTVLGASDNQRRSLTENYLTLVPQKVSGREWPSTFLQGPKEVSEQENLLRQLRTSLDLYETNAAAAASDKDEVDTSTYDNLFNCTLRLADADTTARIITKYNKTRSDGHPSSRLRVKNVFTLAYDSETESKFQKVAADLGNVKELWHGTDSGNVLSILREGLYCPPLGSAKFRTTGRMFGDGVYASDISTKALAYSYGTWHGNRNNRCFAFVLDAVMGNEYWPNRDRSSGGRFNQRNAHYGTNAEGKRFNSISAKGGTLGLVNNEMIVWNREQLILRYLVEFGM